MKWKQRWRLILLSPLFLGLSSGGLVELEGYFNGRYSANFTKSAQNIKTVLPPGTQGRIDEIKKFNSGNYGLKIDVLSGPNKGEKVWVHYNPSRPGIKLYENATTLRQERPTPNPETASHAKTTKKTEALRVPANAEEIEQSKNAEKLVRQIQQGNQSVQNHGHPGGPCATCEVANFYARDSYSPRKSVDAPTLQSPKRTVNPFGIRPTRCRSLPGNYDSCTFEGDSEPGFFKLNNDGPNRIVTKGAGRSREWTFRFEGNASQDLGFSITDAPNGTISQMQESFLMLFPRSTLPHIRIVGNRQIVTLPTGETVTFNKDTREVLAGVLTENGAMTSGGRDLAPANVNYHGTGVLVRVDSRGQEPRLNRKGTATVTKQGRTCKVPVIDLWPNQSENSPVHFKFATDAEFNSYLQRKCGFGL